MKRVSIAILVLTVMLFACGCAQTHVSKNADVVLSFVHEEKNIKVTLEEEEAQKVIAIFDEKEYDPFTWTVPSCGYSPDISLTVGYRVFGLASDTCNGILDYSGLRYFSIPEEDLQYLHSLFEKYGGYFPCI